MTEVEKRACPVRPNMMQNSSFKSAIRKLRSLSSSTSAYSYEQIKEESDDQHTSGI